MTDRYRCVVWPAPAENICSDFFKPQLVQLC